MQSRVQLHPSSPIRSKRVGLMAELTGPANLEPMIHAACKALDAAGIETIVVSSGSSAQSELVAWDILARHDCDGFIVHSDTLCNDQLARLKSARKHTVFTAIEFSMAGKLAASVIAKLGHLDVAMVAGSDQRFSVQQRCLGFIQQLHLAESSAITVKTINTEDISIQAGRRAMHQLLDLSSRPTAVFFHDMSMALGAMDACRDEHIKVPDDISFLTCCERDFTGMTTPNICMVRQPLQAIGECAANRILALLHEKSKISYTSTTAWPAPYIEFHNSLKERNAGTVDAQVQRISNREKECLQWAAKGKTSWEISQILGVTESTVIYHLRNATRKLDAANRLHAVTKALKASIIDF